MASKPKIRLTPMSHGWTAEEVEDAKYMMRLFGTNSSSVSVVRTVYGHLLLCIYKIKYTNGHSVLTVSDEVELNRSLFPSLRDGEEASLIAIYLGFPAEREDVNVANL